MRLSLFELAEVVKARNDVSAYGDLALSKLEFDSRKIEAGDVFLALKGERDGHDFIGTAFERGCAVALTERPVDYPHILVDDCLTALQDLATYYVTKMGVEVVAVTGSNGKTTTKDMIYDVLATSYKTYKTQGNYNNEIGLPYTILHMPDDTEKLVLEMGQDHLGDIHLLSEIARPKISVITLFGEAHLAFFGSRDEIAKGKMQIADGMADGQVLILPDDPMTKPFLPDKLKLVFFGQGADLSLYDLVESKDSLTFKVNFMDEPIQLPVTGKYNATNAMLAAYVGRLLGVSDQAIITALANLRLTKNRTEWKKAASGADILSDVYNANPTAMCLILETFSTIPANEGGRKLVVLADMKELGDRSVALHNQMIDSLSPDCLDLLFFYGQDIEGLSDLAKEKFPTDKVFFFRKNEQEEQFDALLASLLENLAASDQILLKGSNSMNLSKIVDILVAGEAD